MSTEKTTPRPASAEVCRTRNSACACAMNCCANSRRISASTGRISLARRRHLRAAPVVTAVTCSGSRVSGCGFERNLSMQLLALSTLILSILLLITGNAFLMTLLGVRLSLEGMQPALIGPILACYSLGFVIGTLHADKLIARVGHIRTFSTFAAVASCATLLHPLWINMIWWGLLRFLSGYAMASLLIVLESWFSSRANNSNRGTLFAIYLITFYLATALGQLLLNAGDPGSFKLFSITALLLSLALIPIALTRL